MQEQGLVARVRRRYKCTTVSNHAPSTAPQRTGCAMSEPEYQAWARINCVTRGARAGGGTAELKARATADLLDFLSVHGFGVAKPPQPATIHGARDVSA